MPPVSIVLPVRNGAHWLREAIASCLRQTFSDFEIIIIDDESSDESISIVNFFNDPRIRLMHTEPAHAGLIAALQLGCAEAQGEFIARMDADDVMHPRRLEKQVAVFEHNSDLAVCATQVGMLGGENNEGLQRYIDWQNNLLTTKDHQRERFIESPLVHPSVMFRREALEKIGDYQDNGWAEDYDLWLRMLHADMQFVKIPEKLLQWRDRADRLTRIGERYSQEKFLRAKAHYLAKSKLAKEKGVVICGAGPIGKKMGRFLKEEGIVIHAYYDVHRAAYRRKYCWSSR